MRPILVVLAASLALVACSPEPETPAEREPTPEPASTLAGVDLSRWILTRLIDAEAAEKCVASASAVGDGLTFPKA